MSKFYRMALLPLMLICTYSFAAQAQTIGMLRVSPVSIDAQAPVSSGTLRMTNSGDKPMMVQVRVFKWRQENGRDIYSRANDVAVSPPMMTLKPHADSVIRVVRTAKTPISSEESYRVVVDQLPDPKLRATSRKAVSFVVRHNLPAFFSPKGEKAANIIWSVAAQKGGYVVTAKNVGNRHIALAQVKLMAGQTVLGQVTGLAGYALAGSTGQFYVRAKGGGKPDRILAMDGDKNPVAGSF
ncbi:fimbrial biogenesis chaperone [Bartonella sp. LJL80]